MSGRAVSHPDIDQLTSAQLGALRGALHEELAAQRLQLEEHQAVVDELTAQPGTELHERTLAEGSRRRAVEHIGEIEQALRRIDAGSYGHCAGCGALIPFARLEAVPFTRSCVSCPPVVAPIG